MYPGCFTRENHKDIHRLLIKKVLLFRYQSSSILGCKDSVIGFQKIRTYEMQVSLFK